MLPHKKPVMNEIQKVYDKGRTSIKPERTTIFRLYAI